MYENNEKKLEKYMCLILKNFKKIRQKMNPGDFS